MVPKSLRTWFVIHFVADMIFAIPLLFAPVWLLTTFGFETVDPLTARLVGAALLGIGGESLLGRNASADTFRAMLNLKIIWSLGAIFGIAVSLDAQSPPMGYALLAIFIAFNIIWVDYRLKLRN